ncbi:MAG: outer membrane protein assembly factor BamE [Burkholderiales bacterium]|nr:outer membrane protein assembly factor BamE [Burkholderiales bacterium]
MKQFFILAICFTISGCSGIKFSEWRFPYMMEVQQGNYITNDQFNQLHTGITKEQASFIIGHPLTQFLFEQNRWDFFYQDYKSNKLKKDYIVTLLFNKENQVTSITKTGVLFDK